MMKYIANSICLVICLLLPKLALAKPLMVKMEADAKVANEKLVVFGKTNLPIDTKLSVTYKGLINKEWLSTNTHVTKGGLFKTKPFGSKIRDGRYEVDILTLFSQPNSVQNVLGKNGLYLAGSLVKKDILGKGVYYSFLFDVGTKSSIENLEMLHNKNIAEIKSKAEKILTSGFLMSKLRKSDMQKCMRMLRQNQPEIEKLLESTKPLSPYYTYLKSALVRLSLCAICTESALEECYRAKADLSDFQQKQLTELS